MRRAGGGYSRLAIRCAAESAASSGGVQYNEPPTGAPVVQFDRALGHKPLGREFESFSPPSTRAIFSKA